jgi:hypothetical protein
MKLRDKLRQFLLDKFPDAHKASGDREVAMRCRFCGDSSTDRKATHFYIFLGDDDKPPMYNCFKCPAHGVLTPEVLESLVNCSENRDVLLELRAHNEKAAKLSKNKLGQNKKYKIRNNYIRDDELSRAKLHYINKRLGLNLSYQDLLENKIVLNLLDLLNSNAIDKYTLYPNLVKELDDSFIGFLSMDNGFLNLKNLRKKGIVSKYIDRRYTNYSIFKDEDTSRRFYNIPIRCNLVSPIPIQIHIAEGPFDILSIFYNLYGANRQQNIYTSAGGKGYFNVVKLYLTGLGIMNCIFHIYVDNDVPNDEIRLISELLSPLGIQVFIHRNMYPGEKDYGVRIEKIKDYIIRL